MGEFYREADASKIPRALAAPVPMQQKQKLEQAEWSRKGASLKKLAVLLDRDVKAFYTTRSDLHQDATALHEQERALAREREAEAGAAMKRLEDLKAGMFKIKLGIERLFEGADIAGGLDRVIGELEDELYEFKCDMRNNQTELAAEEKEVTKEVDEFRCMVKEWEKNTRVNTPLSVQGVPGKGEDKKRLVGGGGGNYGKERKIFGDKSNNNANPNAITGGASNGDGMWVSKGEGRGGGDGGGGGGGVMHGNAVEVINALIKREGGATGGWPSHEHECFLRLWTQVKRGPSSGARPPRSSPADRAAVSSLVQRASTLMPARAAEEVREHLAWHERHQGYLEEKRRLAKEWRRGRMQLEHEQAEAETVEVSKCGVFATGFAVDEEERKAATRERQRKKKEVEAWRAAKQIEEQERVEREEQLRANQEAKVEEEKRHQRRVQEEVAAYRLSRDREDARRREVERMLAREHKRMHSQAVLDQRAKKEIDDTRRRRQEASSRECQRLEAEERKRAVASGRWSGVAADRTRLLRATKASKERALEPEDLDDQEDARAIRPAHCSRIAMSGRDLRFAGRAVPAWRRGCS